jgi:ADP-heptose:LPS heptosyltransferase
MALRDMIPLFSVPDVDWVSLQLGDPASQLRELATDVVIHDVSDKLKDWADTAGLIAGLDLVISVDTAVAHLAGALGKPVWVLNRFDSCWRWIRGRADTPWYPSMRLYQQERPDDWSGPVGAITSDLARLAAA